MTAHGAEPLSHTDRGQVVPATPDNIAWAAQILRNGDIVAFPTETVYGLGADACNDRAVAAVFAAKGRPSFNPLIIHFPSVDRAREQVRFDSRAVALAAAFWPGPLTLVLPRHADSNVSLLASAGLDTLAVRVPQHPVAHALLAACGRPIAAPSANISGRVSPTLAEHAARSLGTKVTLILDGGPCAVGLESTVIDLAHERAMLLRPGGITEERITEVIGQLKATGASDTPRAPGMLESHYAPRVPLRTDATEARAGEALLAFGPRTPKCRGPMLNLSPTGDLMEAAANLFAMLRSLEDSGVDSIAAMPVPEKGLGRAINDRLRRAGQSR